MILEGVKRSIDNDELDQSVMDDLQEKMSMSKMSNLSAAMPIKSEIEPIPLTSLCVDSTFYVLRTSLQRTIKTKSLEPTCAMLTLCIEILTNKLANYLKKTIQNGYPSGTSITETLGLDALVDKQAEDNAADKTKFEFLAACNNAEKAVKNISSFVKQLQEQILSNFSHVNDEDNKRLNHYLSELKQTAKTYQQLQDLALHELNQQCLRQQVRPQIANFLSVNRVLTVEEHAEYQANDPWVQQVIYTMDDLLTVFRQILSEEIYSQLVSRLTAQVTTHLEQLIKKSAFNQLGAMQLEIELRHIINYLSKTSSRTVRHQFAKLLQISRLLNLERPTELLDYWGVNAGSMTWLLTPGDIRTVLNLRQDFNKDEIRRLTL